MDGYISSILLLIAIATTCHGQYDDYDVFDVRHKHCRIHCIAGRMTGEIYQGEGCAAQEMGTEESGKTFARVESVI